MCVPQVFIYIIHDCMLSLPLLLRVVVSVVVVVFQNIFRLKNIFLFFKNYFEHKYIKMI
jgi:hypothetical protein